MKKEELQAVLFGWPQHSWSRFLTSLLNCKSSKPNHFRTL